MIFFRNLVMQIYHDPVKYLVFIQKLFIYDENLLPTVIETDTLGEVAIVWSDCVLRQTCYTI